MNQLTEEQKLLLKEFITTEDHNRRDDIALKLSDDKAPELISFIITLLFKPETKKHRSTLIYCLQQYDIEDFGIDDLFYLSEYSKIEDNYGCKMEIKILLNGLL